MSSRTRFSLRVAVLAVSALGCAGEPCLARAKHATTCGDVNADDGVNLSDAVYLLDFLFRGGEALQCSGGSLACADVNGDEGVNLSDPVYLLNHLFLGGPAPECGVYVETLSDSGPGSLRQALLDAPAGAAIRFAPGTSGTIVLSSGELTFERDVAIEGPGAADLRVSGDNASRVFRVSPGVAATIRNLTVADGSSSFGAGIQSGGDLSLERVVVENCKCPGFGHTGGVLSDGGGTLRVLECTVRNCSAFNGGALSSIGGSAIIDRSTFSGNSTTGNSGGALCVDGATVTITNSTISGNTVTGVDRVGGGIAVFTEGGTTVVSLFNATVFANMSTGRGGGIFMEGGILRLKSSIVAGNTAPEGPDIFAGTSDGEAAAAIESAGYNLVGDGTDSTLVDGVHDDQVGTKLSPIVPLLWPLSPNGGPTDTHEVVVGSPALDRIPVAACTDGGGLPLAVDQRGVPRPQGTLCDIGAFERQ